MDIEELRKLFEARYPSHSYTKLAPLGEKWAAWKACAEALAPTIAALEAKVAELEKDKARLDWADRQANNTNWSVFGRKTIDNMMDYEKEAGNV